MANSNVPQCSRCFGKNWISVLKLDQTTGLSLLQCGGGLAGAEEMSHGCDRIIIATEAQMTAGGVI